MTAEPRHVGPALTAALVAALAAAMATAETGWLEDVTAAAGIDFRHRRAETVRFWFPEIMSGGAAWCDVDGDGWLDLYLVQGGELDAGAPRRAANRLYRNLGDGTFEDATDRAGLGDTGYGMGVACADYDGDGDSDLYLTNVGPNALYRNLGDGTFEEVAAAMGVADPAWGVSTAFVDYDGDRDLDLFVVNYVRWSPQREIRCASGANRRDYCQPENYNAPARDTLYRNDGDRFHDVTVAAGLGRAFGNGLGVVAADLDRDRRPDLYVANDGNPNQLWINLGDGRFEDRALLAGAAVNLTGAAEAGMGVVAADFDADGDEDVVVTHLRGETHTYYRNDAGFFTDVTVLAGLAAAALPFTGFGVGAVDFDHDGHLDLFAANGRVGATLAPIDPDRPYAEPDQLFRGHGDGRFTEVPPQGRDDPGPIGNGRAAAFADYDHDGAVDLVVVDNGGPARLLRNRAGGAGGWLMLRVLDAAGRDADGAVARAEPAGGRRQWRTVRSAYSYCAANDPRAHFGLGSGAARADVVVTWPDGAARRLRALSPGRLYVVPR